jgi:DNA polymerase-3 subunit delta'
MSDEPRALLDRAIASGRVAHAYAFVGEPGSGRMDAARAFAQALLCESRGCGTCRVCRLVEAGQHPDVHVVTATPPEKNPRGPRAIRIDAIRALEREASLRPVMGSRKIFVIDEADRMTEDSPQAFLKTLEEPPAQTVMILILDRARSVPATVLSRCHIVRFEPPAPGPPEAQVEALEMLAEVRAGGVEALFRGADRLDREKAEALVDACWLWCRDVMLASSGAPERLLVGADHAAAIKREAESWRFDDILGALALCRAAREALAVNVSPRLTLEVLVSRLALRAA